MTAPVLLVGDDSVPARVRDELEAVGVPVVAICSAPETLAARAATAAGTPVVIGDPGLEPTWEAAEIDAARAIGLLGGDDLENLKAALLVAAREGSCPIVVRLFSSDLAPGVERMLNDRGRVLSETDVAAPAFVQAALSGNTGQRVTIAGRVLEVAETDPDDPSLVVALCDAASPTDVLPPPDQMGALVLGLVDPTAIVAGARGALPQAIAQQRMAKLTAAREREAARRRRRSHAWDWLRVLPRRAWVLLATIITVGSISTAVFGIEEHLSLVDSIYFTAATMATVGYGDVNLSRAHNWLKLYDVGLMAVSAILLASVLALITDLLVSSRIDRALGRFPRPRRDHVIVCGLGKAGARIIAGLHELGVPCIGVEQHAQAVGIAVARRLEIPVVFADMRTSGALEGLGVREARSLLAVTNDDLTNLQCALAGRESNPGLRVVLRVFDASLAARLDHGSELDLTRSVSALAAPAFSAALLQRPLAAALPLSNVPLRVLETTIPDGSRLDGRLVGDVHAGRELRILSLNDRWRPWNAEELRAGMRVAVVGTRAACDELIADEPAAASLGS